MYERRIKSESWESGPRYIKKMIIYIMIKSSEFNGDIIIWQFVFKKIIVKAILYFFMHDN